MRKIAAFVFILLPSLAMAQVNSPPHPNLEGWKLVEDYESNLDVKIQDGGLVYAAYIGYTEDYQNPHDPNEFVKVIKRYIPVIPITEDNQQEQTLQAEIVSNYSRKDSLDALKKVRKEADTVGYTKWHLTKDLRTGENIITGPVESWLRIQNGDWVYGAGVIEKELYSEIAPDSKEVILVGLKFSLGNKYHIIRVDQADLTQKREDKK